jgi:hypothetical protein
MNYFTPQRFVRLQNLRDEAGLREWDQAASEYAVALAEALPQFPKQLRRLVKEFPLHDADVRSITRKGDVLSITLHPDPPGKNLLILSYTLIEPPTINHSALPREYCTEQASVLYDELALAEPVVGPPSWLAPEDRDRPGARAPVYTHDLLLSNGWEVFLKFRKSDLSFREALLPAPAPAEENEEESLARSAS